MERRPDAERGCGCVVVLIVSAALWLACIGLVYAIARALGLA